MPVISAAVVIAAGAIDHGAHGCSGEWHSMGGGFDDNLEIPTNSRSEGAPLILPSPMLVYSGSSF